MTSIHLERREPARNIQRPGVYAAAYCCLESLLGVSPNAVTVTTPRVNG